VQTAVRSHRNWLKALLELEGKHQSTVRLQPLSARPALRKMPFSGNFLKCVRMRVRRTASNSRTVDAYGHSRHQACELYRNGKSPILMRARAAQSTKYCDTRDTSVYQKSQIAQAQRGAEKKRRIKRHGRGATGAGRPVGGRERTGAGRPVDADVLGPAVHRVMYDVHTVAVAVVLWWCGGVVRGRGGIHGGISHDKI
jgi:hypothetical protein